MKLLKFKTDSTRHGEIISWIAYRKKSKKTLVTLSKVFTATFLILPPIFTGSETDERRTNEETGPSRGTV